jgi:hypothetical protein
VIVIDVSRQTGEICEDERHTKGGRVADDQWLLTREATELLSAELGYPVSQDTLRRHDAAGRLRVMRAPSTGPGHSRRRFSQQSVLDLARAMKMPPGPQQDEAMAALVENSKR